MNKTSVATFFLLLSSCSSTYVLHWREPNKVFNILDKPQETSPIPHTQGLALLYDRSQWVPTQEKEADGSAWVYYQVVLDNSSPQSQQISSQLIRLEGSEGHSATATFEKSDQLSHVETIKGNSRYTLPLRFHLNAEMVKKFAGSNVPLKLVVPLHPSKKELRLTLWLWKS